MDDEDPKRAKARGSATKRIRTKPLRAPVGAGDGTRIYIGRRYPRGVKDGTLWAERIHDLGPSLDLHRAVLHEALDHETYVARFLNEMRSPAAKTLIRKLARRVAGGETITLLCDHPKALPDDQCHRFLVQRLIEDEPGRGA